MDDPVTVECEDCGGTLGDHTRVCWEAQRATLNADRDRYIARCKKLEAERDAMREILK